MRLLSTRLLAPRYDALRHAYLRLLYGPSRAPLARAPNFRRALSPRENFFLPPPPPPPPANSRVGCLRLDSLRAFCARSSRAIIRLSLSRARRRARSDHALSMRKNEAPNESRKCAMRRVPSVSMHEMTFLMSIRSRASLLQAMMQRVAPSRPCVQSI